MKSAGIPEAQAPVSHFNYAYGRALIHPICLQQNGDVSLHTMFRTLCVRIHQ